jgi:hypothetical protein
MAALAGAEKTTGPDEAGPSAVSAAERCGAVHYWRVIVTLSTEASMRLPVAASAVANRTRTV